MGFEKRKGHLKGDCLRNFLTVMLLRKVIVSQDL